jgi:hypothetical protein
MHGSTYGKVGHLTNVASSYGWLLIIAAGQLTGWHAITSRIRIDALYVISKRVKRGTVTVQVLLKFLNLCDLIDEVPLQPGVEDKHI